MKRIIAILLTLGMLLSLAACGGGGADDPNAGEYRGVSVSMMGVDLGMEEVYPGENKLVLKNGGKAELILEGDKINGKWTLEGETFNLVVDGEDCPGTLKNGVVTFDFAGSGIMMTFRKEGGTGNSIADKLNGGEIPDEQAKPVGPLGLYRGDTYEYSGQSFKMGDIYDGQCTIELLDGGKAVFFLGGEEMQCTWELDGEDFILDNQAVKSHGSLVDGVITLDFMNMGMIMTFVQDSGAEQTPTEGTVTETAGMFPETFVEMHQGDWHGMAVVYDGTGVFADEQDMEMEIIARLAFRENGTCEPYLACAFGGKDNNFKNLSAEYDDMSDVMMLSGEFVNAVLTANSNLFVLDGKLFVDVYADDGEGNTLNLYAVLRRLDEEWDYENDWPCLPKDAVAFYKGKDFLEIAELFQVDVDEIPELDTQSGGQQASSKEPAPSGDGILDYETICEVYDWVLFYSSSANNYGKISYEEIVERMGGVQGAPAREDLWNEKTRFYTWGISEDEYIQLTFSLKDGVWIKSGATNTTAFMEIYKKYHG